LQLKKHWIHQLIVIGLISHCCVEATVRFAAELGYEVTVVRDATADYSDEAMHAALNVNIAHYASAIVDAKEIVASISASEPKDSAACPSRGRGQLGVAEAYSMRPPQQGNGTASTRWDREGVRGFGGRVRRGAVSAARSWRIRAMVSARAPLAKKP
jgi:hypothetical protein